MWIRRAERTKFRCQVGQVLILGLMLSLAACGTLFGSRHDEEANSSAGPSAGGAQDLLSPPQATQPEKQDKIEAKAATSGVGVGVNSYLWRASLDTLSFMPLASADPFGGVIITEWYQAPNVANERFKVTVYILDRRLRADALKVSVFHQQQDKKGNWVDATLDPETPAKLENAILTRARQMRIATTGND